jgi:hypothetical protein
MTLINKRLQKLNRLNLKFMSAVNNDNKTNGNRYNSVLPISSKIVYCQLISNCCSRARNYIFCSTLSEFENFLLCERILINLTTCQNETSS